MCHYKTIFCFTSNFNCNYFLVFWLLKFLTIYSDHGFLSPNLIPDPPPSLHPSNILSSFYLWGKRGQIKKNKPEFIIKKTVYFPLSPGPDIITHLHFPICSHSTHEISSIFLFQGSMGAFPEPSLVPSLSGTENCSTVILCLLFFLRFNMGQGNISVIDNEDPILHFSQ